MGRACCPASWFLVEFHATCSMRCWSPRWSTQWHLFHRTKMVEYLNVVCRAAGFLSSLAGIDESSISDANGKKTWRRQSWEFSVLCMGTYFALAPAEFAFLAVCYCCCFSFCFCHFCYDYWFNCSADKYSDSGLDCFPSELAAVRQRSLGSALQWTCWAHIFHLLVYLNLNLFSHVLLLKYKKCEINNWIIGTWWKIDFGIPLHGTTYSFSCAYICLKDDHCCHNCW